MPHLILQESGSQARIIHLTKSTTTLGRKSNSDIFLTDQSVSRDHAEIIKLQDENYEIHDLGAKHPTSVNGKIISSQRLKDGDKITLGESVLIFRSKVPCSATHVEFLAAETMAHDTMEVSSLDAKKTALLSNDDSDLISLQRDHQRLMLLYEFGKVINMQLEDPHLLLNEILSTTFRTLDAERGFIALVDENTGELTCELVQDNSIDEEDEKLEVSRTIIHKVLKGGTSLLTVNALKDGEFRNAKSVKEYSIRSAICAPLIFKGVVMGVVYLDNRISTERFSQDDLAFLTALCHQAGIALGNAWLHRQVVHENIRLDEAMKPKYQLVGGSENMKMVYNTIKKVAPTDITVFIQGATGTGKELVAQAIHALSPRCDQPFIPVNCAAIPKDLIESELFGHEKGAFTSAVNSRQGKFEMAHQGTVFLDEIGDMSLETQAKALRVLEEKELQRVGGSKNIKVDVRVIAATNKDLGNAVEEGTFREDLFYRLNVVSLKIPKLAERKEDIIPLAEYFAAGRVKNISARAKRLLLDYDWPGNVRELKNYIERAVVLGGGEVIQPEDLPLNVRRGGKVIPSPLESLDNMEEDHIIRVLRHTNWHKSDAANILGVTRQTLDNKIAKFKIKK